MNSSTTVLEYSAKNKASQHAPSGIIFRHRFSENTPGIFPLSGSPAVIMSERYAPTLVGATIKIGALRSTQTRGNPTF